MDVRQGLSDLPAKGRKSVTNKKPGSEAGRPANVFRHYALYQRGVKQMQEKGRLAEEAKQKREQTERAEATFKPHINANSRHMVSRDVERHEDYLLSYGKMVQEKLSEKRMEQAISETRGAFKPYISVMSQRIVAEKSKDKMAGAHQQLYEDAIRRKEQYKMALPTEFTFTPCLSTLDPNMFKGVDKPVKKVGMYVPRDKTSRTPEERLKKECTFVPMINNIPEYNEKRKEIHVSVGDYLQGVQKTYEEKTQKKKEEEEKRSKEMANKRFVQDKSKQMLGKYEKDKFAEIFKALDADNDGVISASKIDITRIAPT